MSRASCLRETLYYGSDRQQQYWENEAQTIRIVRDARSLMWKAYRKKMASIPLFRYDTFLQDARGAKRLNRFF